MILNVIIVKKAKKKFVNELNYNMKNIDIPYNNIYSIKFHFIKCIEEEQHGNHISLVQSVRGYFMHCCLALRFNREISRLQ